MALKMNQNLDQNLINKLATSFWNDCPLKSQFRDKIICEVIDFIIDFVIIHTNMQKIDVKLLYKLIHVMSNQLNGSIFCTDRNDILKILVNEKQSIIRCLLS